MSLEKPDKGDFSNTEVDVDIEGNPRKAQQFEDGEVFWGSEKEILERTAEKREELHNK